MQENITEEVQQVLTEAPDQITLENIQTEDTSPLNQPVIEKDIGGEKQIETNPSWNVWKPQRAQEDNERETQLDFREATEEAIALEKAKAPLDAPEQEIETSVSSEIGIEEEKEVALISTTQATQAADALLGMTNNLLEVGGGYFVKINKHEAFFEFEEIIQLIDEQNTSNVERIKLDQEDQALLRPLLAQVLQKKAKKLTPEQQLMGAIISILVKKAQVVMEVRAENNLLESRILQIIKEEKDTAVVQEEADGNHDEIIEEIPVVEVSKEENQSEDAA